MAGGLVLVVTHSRSIQHTLGSHYRRQNTELVKLDEGMKYTTSDHFNRNIYRHLRFKYPTYIFNDLSFEIDDNGVPYWISPVKKFNIGLFGGTTVGRVVLCNAITGETKDYKIEDAPEWIDRAYSADMLLKYSGYGFPVKGFCPCALLFRVDLQ